MLQVAASKTSLYMCTAGQQHCGIGKLIRKPISLAPNVCDTPPKFGKGMWNECELPDTALI